VYASNVIQFVSQFGFSNFKVKIQLSLQKMGQSSNLKLGLPLITNPTFASRNRNQNTGWKKDINL
jgi:hypothetical protein